MIRVLFCLLIYCMSAFPPISLHAGPPEEKTWEYHFEVTHQKQFYQIDPLRKIFRSLQEITLENKAKEPVRRIAFAIHPDLDIRHLRVRDEGNRDMACSAPRQVGEETFFKKYTFPVMGVTVESALPPGGKCRLHMEYRMKPEAVLPAPENMYALTVSPKSTYSIGPVSGNNLYFGHNVSSPFEIILQYPAGNHACAPGERINRIPSRETIRETYVSTRPNVPTFACAPYRKVQRRRGDVTVEFYLYPHETFAESMVDNLTQAVRLYFDAFGDNHTRAYRFATVGMFHYPRPGGESKGNAIFFPDSTTANYARGGTGKIDYAEFVYHEVFHNWNLFFLHWQGPLYEWFTEGGANFICAWAVERTLGPGAAVYVRDKYIRRLIKDRGMDAPAALWNIRKNGKLERTLIYTYGALVWEQLRLKLGDPALFAGLKDFFTGCKEKRSDYKELCRSFAPYSTVPVAEFLRPWLTGKPRIRVTLDRVDVTRKKGGFLTRVTARCDVDSEIEIATALGFRTAKGDELKILPVRFTRPGTTLFTFKSPERPVYIEIDPECRVPRTNTENRTWPSRKDSPG